MKNVLKKFSELNKKKKVMALMIFLCFLVSCGGIGSAAFVAISGGASSSATIPFTASISITD